LVGTTQTMNAGIRSLAKGGRFVSTGYTDQQIEIHPIEFILPETSLLSTVAATRLDLQDALSLCAAGALTVPIAATYPIDGLDDALAALRQRAGVGPQGLQLACGPARERCSEISSASSLSTPQTKEERMAPPTIKPQIDFLEEPMRLYIDGRFVETEGSLASVDPATGRTLADAPLATEREGDAAGTAAAQAIGGWGDTP